LPIRPARFEVRKTRPVIRLTWGSIAKISARILTPSFYLWFAENATNLAKEAVNEFEFLTFAASQMLSRGRMAILGKKPPA